MVMWLTAVRALEVPAPAAALAPDGPAAAPAAAIQVVSPQAVSPTVSTAAPLGEVQRYFADRVSAVGRRLADHHAGLARPFAGIALWRFLAFGALVLLTLTAGALASWVLRTFGARLTARTAWRFDDLVVVGAAEPLRLAVQAAGLWAALMLLVVDTAPRFIVVSCTRLAMAVVASAALWYLYRLVDIVEHSLRGLAQRTESELDDTVVHVIRKALRVILLAVGIVFIGNNVLDWDITALLASAGVVGLAVAFAAQDTIANLFGTLMVLIDRPFRIGERVIIDGADGPVESIGFRSTRIRTLDGHLVTLPNKAVADAKVENVGRRASIKRVMKIGVTYDTPAAKVGRAVQIIRDVLAQHRCQSPDFPPRVYFSEFADCALTILAITWFQSNDYWDYLAWCEETNLEIMRRFEAEGIEFAFPTTTAYLAGDPKRPLVVTHRDAAEPAR
jgi:MscS family membrane protein